ncbi:MAG: hypothetical protein RIS08_1336 [Actinomycetota bacterium]|jgi:hypothetical protein
MMESLASDTAVEFAILAMDELTAEVVQNAIPRAKVFRMDAILSFEPRLENALIGRSTAEQFFTIGPTFLAFCAESAPWARWLVYADADLKFFKPLSRYLSDFDSYATVLAPHRHYWWNARRLAKFGRFNVGMVPFNMSKSGLKLITYWATACLDWCFDKPESGKYADQGYLEKFESEAPGLVAVDSSLGVNLAPWNSSFLQVSVSKMGHLQVGSSPLIYFHFQGLKFVAGRWHLGHISYLSAANKSIRQHVYLPYLTDLEKVRIRHNLPEHGSSRDATSLLGRISARVILWISVILRQRIEAKS